mmetsp:Transcript_5186/g.11309  ORF Transcript_5186/g.11309 Transcript_5186/m.11309 type:complete len:244 (-) Transcript_5186:484-1215(-)
MPVPEWWNNEYIITESPPQIWQLRTSAHPLGSTQARCRRCNMHPLLKPCPQGLCYGHNKFLLSDKPRGVAGHKFVLLCRGFQVLFKPICKPSAFTIQACTAPVRCIILTYRHERLRQHDDSPLNAHLGQHHIEQQVAHLAHVYRCCSSHKHVAAWPHCRTGAGVTVGDAVGQLQWAQLSCVTVGDQQGTHLLIPLFCCMPQRAPRSLCGVGNVPCLQAACKQLLARLTHVCPGCTQQGIAGGM